MLCVDCNRRKATNEIMVQYAQMKFWASIVALIPPACVYAVRLEVPSLPDPLRPRAEAETNVTFSAGAAGDNLWRLSVELDASVSNSVEVVLGIDADGETDEYSDQDVKRQIVFAGRCYHAEDMDSNYEWSFRMAGCDTNRYARVLCELAGENTNQTRRAIALLGVYKTPQSLPFLYSYATNAQYGAYAMKSIFAD